MDLSGKTITIIGAARSGLAAARLIVALNGRAVVTDQKEVVLPEDFKIWALEHDVLIEWGHRRETVQQSDALVISPGVPPGAEVLNWAEEEGIPVWPEIELAFGCCPCPVIAVTGSNGKTTVSTLIAKVIEANGQKAFLCGNVGRPFSQFVGSMASGDFAVVEVSSFQLEAISDFRPHIAVFLNFSQNHLDRHKDLDDYFAAKSRIFDNQSEKDFAVLPEKDSRLRSLAQNIKPQVCFYDEGMDAEDNPNFRAVASVAHILKIDQDICQKVLSAFPGVEHRLEHVRTLNGVRFVNDSKATTAEAGRWALQRSDKPIMMLCGGRDKNIDFSVISPLVQEKVKGLFTFGEAKEKLNQTFEGQTAVTSCADMKEAVQSAFGDSSAGDTVLLSPMCASFDSFQDYEERGRVYKEIVNGLE